MTIEDRAVGEPERLHPLLFVTGLGGALRGMAGGYVFVAYLAVSGRLGTALLAAAALLVFVAIGTFLYWRRFEFRVGATEIRIDSGILNRTHRSIPFDRVQDVDITQGPVARLLGLAQVKFETGASAGNEEGVLRAIALQRAEELRDLIRAYRSETIAAAAEEPHPDRPPVYAMDLNRLLLAGLFNFSLAVFAGLFGLSQTVGDVIGFDPLNRVFWSSMLSASNPIAQFVLANRLAAAVAGILSLVLVGIVTGIVRTTLRDYRFRLDRTESGFRRRRGLLTLTDVSLPARRAQAAIVGTGPVRDRFGWRELKLQSLARDEGGSGDHVLAPLATDDEIATILDSLGWRPMDTASHWQQVSRAHVWLVLPAVVLLLVAAAVQAFLVPPVTVLLIAVAALVIGIRWLAWRRTGYRLDGDRLLIRSGWWRRRILLLPVRRIQSIDIDQTFVSRWFGISTMTLGVAGGSGFSAHRIPALPQEKASEIRDQLLSRML